MTALHRSFATVVLASFLVFMGCTDSPPPGSVNGSGCPAGEVLDDDGQCVPDGGETNQEPNQEEPTWNQDGPPDHPHDGRDELDPWGDESGDGVPNQYDNCPFHYNPDQTDTSGDGVGDVCDNCPHVANPDQAVSPGNPVDERGIVMGDACAPGVTYYDTETDTSGDGVPDVIDNCPELYNPDQTDTSGDGVGDACDNCPNHYNPDQTAAPGNPVDDRGIVMGNACAPVPNNIPICENQITEFQRLQPNIYMSLDISGSMGWSISGTNFNPPAGTSRWDVALQGLNQVFTQLAGDIRYGMGTFPTASATCGIAHITNIGDYSASEILASYQSLSPTGGTPTRAALLDILNNNRLDDPSDPHDDLRTKAILLVTDGEPNCDSGNNSQDVQNVINVLQDLYAAGIPTFVVGFAHATSTMQQFAQAGGTGDYFLADDAQSLADAIQEVADLLVGCSFTVDTTHPDADPNQLWIKVDGDYLHRDDYTFDTGTGLLTLSQSACDYLQSVASDELTLEVEMGCTPECIPEQPSGLLCDLYYETCGEPYPCDICSYEICDGTDNSCTGVIDDNCPDCSIYMAPCQTTDDCCEPFICNDQGFCDRDCYPVGVACDAPSDCCTNLCGNGVCIGN